MILSCQPHFDRLIEMSNHDHLVNRDPTASRTDSFLPADDSNPTHAMRHQHLPPRRHGLKTISFSVMLLVLSTCLMGCKGLQELSADGHQSARGSWLELLDARQLPLSPGLLLELPDAPYRAQFADPEGIYFQASRPLRFVTQHGFVNEVDGGLYMRYDNHTQATTWFHPKLGAPITPYPAAVKIQYYPARY